MEKKKILILSDIAPCTNITSGIVLNQWCKFLLEEKCDIHYVLVSDPNIKMDIPSNLSNQIHLYKYDKPREGWGIDSTNLKNKIKGYFRSYIGNKKSRKRDLPIILKEIIDIINKENIDLMMSSIQGQTMTWLTYNLIKKTNIRHVSQTWDPLEWWLDAFKFDPLSKKINLNMFKKVCRKSDTFMGMSWAMSINFEKKYGANCVTNIPSLESEKYKVYKKKDSKEFNIALSGQIYASDEFDLLVSVCNDLNWKYNGKDIFINLYGTYFSEKYKNHNNIKIHGHLPQEELIKKLKKMDLLYCPYWFSKKYVKPAKLSFPGKLTTYLKVGRPILMHGPSYASPLIFAKCSKAAYIADTNDFDEFKSIIIKIIKNNNNERMLKNANKVFNKYLTFPVMKKSLLASLGLISVDNNDELEEVRKYYE